MKNKMLKKLTSIIICILLLASIIPLGTFTATAETYLYYTYTVSNGEATITKCNTSISGNQIIPSTLGGCAVTSIGDNAFYYCTGLTSITIPNSVTSIGSSAFYGCSRLKSIEIPNSVTSIGYSAFGDCTGLTSITLPDSVSSIGEGAFSYCTGLTSITVEEGNKKYHSSGNCLIETETGALIKGCNNSIIPSDNSVTSIGNYAFDGCTGLTSITIPDSVTSIGNYAFDRCTGLTSITIPDSVTSIGNYAFYYCIGLTSVTIGDSVKYIGEDAFYNCTGLTSVTIPDSVTSISGSAFEGCTGLTSITIPDSVKTIGDRAFYGCIVLTSVTIGSSVTSIGSSAFYGCSRLKSIEIPNSVTSIGYSAFYGCTGLTSVTIGNSVKKIGDYAFYNCTGLTSVTIGNSVTSIGIYAFYGCKGLTSVTIPDSVISIGDSAFSGCTGLKSVIIPNSVTSIGYRAFDGCSSLQEITLPFVGDKRHTPTDTYQYPFGYIFGGDSYTGGTATTQYYYGTFTWTTTSKTYYISSTLKKVTITDSEYIPYGAFYNCSNLTSVTTGNSVKKIGDYAFYNCTGLTSVTIPDSVTSTGDYAFSGCTGLEIIAIPESVTYIGQDAIPKSTIIICNKGSYAEKFANENGYKYKNNLCNCGNNAEWYIYNNTMFITGTGETENHKAQGSVPWYEFSENIQTVVIDPGITKIGTYSFYCLNNLKNIICQNKDTAFGKYSVNAGNNTSICAQTGGAAQQFATDNCIGFVDLTPVSELESKTANSITVNTVSGYEYSINGGTSWQTSGTFSGLSPAKEYKIYARLIAANTYIGDMLGTPLTAKTLKSTVSAPAKPVCISNTDTTITITPNESYEFSIDGVNWQKSNVFEGLIHRNTYSIYQRVAETDTEYASAPSEALILQLVKKTVSAPAKPVCISNTDTKITITPNENYEFSLDGINWQKSNVFEGLIHRNTYSIYQRVAETDTEYASAASPALIMQLIKKTVSAPKAPDYLSHTADSITVVANPAYEYSLDGEKWQTSASFNNLSKNVIYSIYARVAETDTEYASAASKPLIIALPGAAQLVCGSDESLSVKAVEGFEYCIDDFLWQDSSTFNMLLEDTSYTVYQRLKAIENEKVYQITSAPALFTTSNSLPQHDYTDEIITSTCVARGFTKHTCKNCGYSFNDTYTEIGGHTEVTDKAVAPTCTTTGLTEGKHCSACNTVLVAQTVVPALGHDKTHHDAKAATCTEKGWNAYDTCSRCDYTTYSEIAPLGHDYKAVITKPTCTAQGYTTHTCSRCNDSYVDTYVDALGHDKIHHDAKAATCTEKGWNAYDTCSRCDYTTYSEIAPLGHDYKAVITKPTCTAQGYTTHTCSRCNDSYVDTYVDALGHTEVIDKAVAPTCTATGLTEGKHCLVCNAVLVAQIEIPALGHDKIHHDAKNPTCTEKGWNVYDTCSRCDYTTYCEIDSLGHNYNSVVTNPTCTENGYTTHTCSRCKDSYVDTYVDALGHTVVIDKAVEATCTKTGLTEGKHCSACNTVLTAQSVVPALGHTMVNGKCSVCGYQAQKVNFPDVSYSAWYGDAVAYAVEAGLMKGYGSGKFGTADGIQRQDFVVILSRLSGDDLSQYEGKTSFKDVSKGAYYAAALAWAKAKGVSSGYANGKFGVGDKVTREQIMVFLYNYAKLKGYDTTATMTEAQAKATYADFGKVSGYAKEAALWALSKGVVSGKDAGGGKKLIAPQANALRCEVAAMFYNIEQKGIFE